MRKRFGCCDPLNCYQESFNPTWTRHICPGHGRTGEHEQDSLTAGSYLLHQLENLHVRTLLLIKSGSRKPQTRCRLQRIHKETRPAPTRLQSKKYINPKANINKKTKGKVKTSKLRIFLWNKTHFHSYTAEKEHVNKQLKDFASAF